MQVAETLAHHKVNGVGQRQPHHAPGVTPGLGRHELFRRANSTSLRNEPTAPGGSAASASRAGWPPMSKVGSFVRSASSPRVLATVQRLNCTGEGSASQSVAVGSAVNSAMAAAQPGAEEMGVPFMGWGGVR